MSHTAWHITYTDPDLQVLNPSRGICDLEFCPHEGQAGTLTLSGTQRYAGYGPWFRMDPWADRLLRLLTPGPGGVAVWHGILLLGAFITDQPFCLHRALRDTWHRGIGLYVYVPINPLLLNKRRIHVTRPNSATHWIKVGITLVHCFATYNKLVK